MSALDAWLKAQAPTLDSLIAAASEEDFDAHPEWTPFELDQTLDDIWRLSERVKDARDCFYDRPSIGPTYAMWYHGRRTQDMLRRIRPWCDEDDEGDWTVIDLGCGTGATVWALGLLAVGLQEVEDEQLHIQVHAIDSSPFMLAFAKRMLEHFQNKYPESGDLLDVSFRSESWVHASVECRERPRVCACYLLDHSDSERVPEIAAALRSVAERHQAGRTLTIAASPKEHLLDLACGEFDPKRWELCRTPTCSAAYWRGTLDATHAQRSCIYASRLRDGSHRWQRAPVWGADETIARQLKSLVPKQRGLFGVPELPRLALDTEQQRASQVGDRSAVIVGAAGSGKSVVLAERIAKTVRASTKDKRILVTAFNKGVIDQLARWINERLPGDLQLKQMNRSGLWTLEATRPNTTFSSLVLMNWDLVPTRLFGVAGRVLTGAQLEEHIEWAIDFARKRHSHRSNQSVDFLRSSFLQAELHRVVYGLGALTRAQYVSVNRDGRGKQMRQSQREMVFSALECITETFTNRWIETLRFAHGLGDQTLSPRPEVERFSHVFVDECQDFTRSDFEVLYHLCDAAGVIVAAGDLTQAMRIGASHRVPPLPSPARWRYHKLGGSYRIPLRVCEAIRPLAESIRAKHRVTDPERFVLPESRKASVLGTRPILIVASSLDAAAREVHRVWRVYGEPVQARTVTVAEEDGELKDRLRRELPRSTTVELQSMHRMKGLERSFVVWSTRVGVDADEAVEEWAYTVLSRTTSSLVIVVTPDSDRALLDVVRMLRRDRLMPWTKAAAEWLANPPSPAAWH